MFRMYTAKLRESIETHRVFKEMSKKFIDLSIEYVMLADKKNDS